MSHAQTKLPARRSSSPGAPARATGPLIAGALAMLAATILIHGASVRDGWIRYDNENLIRREPMVRDLSARGLWRMFTSRHNDLYQPMLTLSVALDYASSKRNPAEAPPGSPMPDHDLRWWHIHSVMGHSFTMLLLLLLLYRLTGHAWASLAGTLLVACHPLLVEPVAWIICRTFLLAGIWIILGTHAYVSYVRRPRWWLLAVHVACYGLSLLGKAMPGIVLLPVLIDLWFRRRFTLRVVLEKLPLLGIVLLVVVVDMVCTARAIDPRVAAMGWFEALRQSKGGMPWGEVLRHVPAGFVLMAANTLWPTKLAIFYFSEGIWAVIGWRWILVLLCGVGVLGAGLWAWYRGRRELLLCAAGWICLIGPSLLASKYRETIATDRYNYVALWFVGLAVAVGCTRAMRTREPQRREARKSGPATARGTPYALLRYAPFGLVLAVSAVLGWRARQQAHKWCNEAALWEDVIRQTPHATAYGALGNVYMQQKRWADAVRVCEQALRLQQSKPRPEFYNNLAQAYRENKQWAESIRTLKQGIARWKSYWPFWYNLGRVYIKTGQIAEAAECLQRAIHLAEQQRQGPQAYKAWYYWGVALHRQGAYEQAIEKFQRAAQLRPAYLRAARALGLTYARLQQWRQAVPWLERVRRAGRADEAVLRALATAYGKLGLPDKARALQPPVRRHPAHP